MTPEEQVLKLITWICDRNWVNRDYFDWVEESKLQDAIGIAFQAAVEEEREAWVEQLKGEVQAAEAKLLTSNRDECQYWEGFRDAAQHAIRARGKQKFCGCGRPSKDPVTGGCGEC